MKKTIFFASLLLAIASGHAENVTIRAVRQPAEKVFVEIMRQTNSNFIYTPDVLDKLVVTINVTNESLEKALEKMFRDTDVKYKIKGKNVILRRAKKQAPKHSKHTVSGFVRDSENSEPLAGATIVDKISGKGVNTNVNGFYSITLPDGEIDLAASCFDYTASASNRLKLTKDVAHDFSLSKAFELEEVVVTSSPDKLHAFYSANVGSSTLPASKIKATPVLFGESDVIKTLQLEPGVSAGVEGLAGLYVHGGNVDENLYMLDNIPLYQVNHLGGLFSAFNTEVMRNVDFYKSSFPAKFDGRLSSYMDVHTKDGRTDKRHGSMSLGLTSGNFAMDGPIGKDGKTTYSVGVRRSWLDLLTIPALAITNSFLKDDKARFRYDFTDINAKITRRFSERSKAWFSVYYGEDFLKGGSKTGIEPSENQWINDTKLKLHWGNIVASAGWNYVISPKIFGEFSAAYTRYFSQMRREESNLTLKNDSVIDNDYLRHSTENSIDDWILKADFDWRPSESHKVNFGSSLVFHSFMPSKQVRTLQTLTSVSEVRNDYKNYKAVEANAYIGDDWTLSDAVRINAGVHTSLFHIDSDTQWGISPRFSISYSPTDKWAAKASYSRAVQYVHQLSQSYISLPTDQWVPITDGFKPQTSDKISLGAYWQPLPGYIFSAEAYYKKMRNLIDYRDEYYLLPPTDTWSASLTSGKGTAKGIDFKISKEAGRFTGHMAYSLMWADRTFAAKNNGKTFPARFDNRHKINALVSYKINDKWEVNASWTGMSGNMFTLATQMWNPPGHLHNSFSHEWGEIYYGSGDDVPYITEINNYRLPFYHRLDIGFIRHTKRGFWTFSLYNAYCNMNTISIRHGWDYEKQKAVFQKLSILPIIPTFSYTWTF